MKKTILLAAITSLLSLNLRAADSSPKDEIASAAKKLGQNASYSWRTTYVVPESSPFHPEPTDGKTEKDGFSLVVMNFNDNVTKLVMKGGKSVVTDSEGKWRTLEEMDKAEGQDQFAGLIARNFKLPEVQAAEIVSYAKDLKNDGDVYSSEMTPEGAKKMLSWKPAPGGEPPKVSNTSGSMKFWMKDGTLTKFEFKLKGTITFNGNDFENERSTTVEIKEAGSTKVEVPAEAKQKLS